MAEPVPLLRAETAEGVGRPVQAVPRDPATRARIQQQARRYAARARIVPPLDFDALREAAVRLRRASGIRAEHADFATVMLGNAAWEETLASVPYEHRVLLLPRCLRDPLRCRAEVDAIGLQCLACGSCRVAELSAEAEALGYQVLVAEGTTAVARLVESGRVGGVVAVACLQSLERSFAAATAGAVPALAIPLLVDGCRATQVDAEAVRRALRLHGDGTSLRQLDFDRLRRSVQSWFTRESLREVLSREGTHTEELAIAAVGASGKRWRPTLAAATCQALGGGEPDAAVVRIALAVECFHKASLVHDDIEDGDAIRSGQPTLQQAHGVPVALNVGDLLIGEGYRLIAGAGLASEVALRMIAVASEAQRELCLGQGEELAWIRERRRLGRDEALSMLRRKTAPAFEVSLVLGALLGRADEPTLGVLRRLSAALGLAYQIRDEIEDAARAEPSPLFVALALERDSETATRLLDGTLGPGERRRLLESVLPEAWAVFDHHRTEALCSLRPLAQQTLKSLLFRLVHLFLGGRRGADAREADAR